MFPSAVSPPVVSYKNLSESTTLSALNYSDLKAVESLLESLISKNTLTSLDIEHYTKVIHTFSLDTFLPSGHTLTRYVLKLLPKVPFDDILLQPFGKDEFNIFSLALYSQNSEIFHLLLANPLVTTAFLNSEIYLENIVTYPLFILISQGIFRDVKACLMAGADYKVMMTLIRGDHKELLSPLHSAILHGNLEVVECLLSNSMSNQELINKPIAYQKLTPQELANQKNTPPSSNSYPKAATPLILAIYHSPQDTITGKKNCAMLQLLSKYGADPSLVDNNGLSAIENLLLQEHTFKSLKVDSLNALLDPPSPQKRAPFGPSTFAYSSMEEID